MSHIVNPITGDPSPSCTCAACVVEAVERIWSAECAAVEKRALQRMLDDMVTAEDQKLCEAAGAYKPGFQDAATHIRLREYFS